MKIHGWLGSLVLGVSASVVIGAEAWTTDYDAARKEASERGALLLTVFSGSDWCGPCKMLKSKVFDTPEFAEYAKGRFVPVDIDFPRMKQQDEATKKQNADLSARYNITGFPTVLVTTPSGDVLGGFVGGRSKLDDVRKPLDAALDVRPVFEAAMETADISQGEERLQALLQAYETIPVELRRYHKALVDQIVEIDEKDVSGLKAKRQKEERVKKERETCKDTLGPAASKGPEVFLKEVDVLLKNDFLPETRFELLNMKSNVQLSLATEPEQFDEAVKTFDEAMAANPAMKERMERFRKDLVERKDRILEDNRKRAEAREKAGK